MNLDQPSLTRSTIAKIESGVGRGAVTFDEAVTFAWVFGVMPAELAPPAPADTDMCQRCGVVPRDMGLHQRWHEQTEATTHDTNGTTIDDEAVEGLPYDLVLRRPRPTR